MSLWFENNVACSIWTLCVICMSVRVKQCLLWGKIEDQDFKNLYKLIYNIFAYDILASEVLLYLLSTKLYISWFGVFGIKLWFSRWLGVELPTKFKSENVYQLQQSIKTFWYRYWKTSYGENIGYVFSFPKSYQLTLTKLVWSRSAMWSEERCCWYRIWEYDLWRAMDLE